jgi:DNA-binding NarL/FixJ family response regulator
MVVGSSSREYNGSMVSYVPKYLRVYLLDDHDIVRQGLRDLLVPAIDIYVVGDSGSAREAARVIPELGIDVMVLDLRLQDGTGIDVCRAVRAADPSVRGLLLTSSGDDEALAAAILAGAAGYVVKLTRSSDITDAIRRVGAGKRLINRDTLEHVGRQLRAACDELRPRLSESERQVLDEVIAGQTNAQIAERTGASLDATTAQVTALITRLTDPMSVQPGPGGAQAGKHRRSDS